MRFDIEAFRQLFSKVINDIMAWLPSLLGAILLVLAGWIAALVIRVILGSILRRFGLDKITEKAGVTRVLSSWGIATPLSAITARIVFWIVFFLFLLAAIESLGLGFVAGAFGSFVTFLPRLLASLVIFMLGMAFSRFVGDAVGLYAERSGIRSGSFLGTFVKYILFVLVFVMALQQLGVETVLFTGVVIVVLSALLLSLAISFGIGNRELARNISAGFHARESFIPGSQIEVGRHEGKLMRIGAFKFIVETAAGQVSLPNHLLTEEEILIAAPENDVQGQ